MYTFLDQILFGPALRAFFEFEVTGKENVPEGGGYIITSNHLTGIDSFLIQASRVWRVQIDYIAKIELAKIPIFSWMMKRTNTILVDRDLEGKLGFNEKKVALDQLKERVSTQMGWGHVIGLFPEGTRSRDGRLHPFKRGVSHIALEMGAVVLPVGIRYGWSWRHPRPRIGIVIGEPIHASCYTRREKEKLTADIRREIAALSGQELAGVDVADAGMF